MRKLLVKYFVGDYVTVLFGFPINWVKAANIIFPIGVLNGVYLVLTNTYSIETLVGSLLLGLFLIALFFGFLYFYFYPPKWEEMDDFQKWQYGSMIVDGNITGKHLNPDQLREFLKLNQDIPDFLKKQEYYNVKALAVNISCIIIAFILMLW